MALTVVSKPSGFRPIGGGELLYTFTEASLSGKSNYRVEIELNGLSVPIFEFRPDASLAIEADIAPMLRAAISMSFDDSSRIASTYVKYQAKWDGGSDSQVSLSSDVIYAYIGVDHDLNHRTKFHIDTSGGQFLVPTEKLYVWRGRTAYLDFNFNFGTTIAVTYYPGGTPVVLDTFTGTSLRSVSYSGWTDNGYIRIYNTSPDITYAIIEVIVLPECSNPIYLKWINDYGGISVWLFDYNQAFGMRPSALYRNKTITVEANNLTMEQYLALEELNKDGVEYGSNSKAGALVVDFTDESNPIDVYVEPEEQETFTKQRAHQFSITLRYDKLPNILV